MTCKNWLPVFGFMLLLLFAGAARQRDESREVRLTLHVATFDGKPHVGLPYVLRAARSSVYQETNERGKAVFRIQVEPEDKRLKIGFEDGTTAKWNADQAYKRQVQVQEFRIAHYYPYSDREHRKLTITIEPGRNDYELNLTTLPALEISGQLINANTGRQVTSAIIRAKWSSATLARPDPNGFFALRGVADVIGNELFIDTFPLITVLEAPRIGENNKVSAGVIKIREVDSALKGKADILTFGTSMFLDIDGRIAGGGGTLVRDDGTLILSMLQGGGRLGPRYTNKQPIEIPAGKYYIAPGMFNARICQLALIDAVRSKVDLLASDIPSVEVKSGETTTVTFDAIAAAQAIARLAEQLPDYADSAGGIIEPITDDRKMQD